MSLVKIRQSVKFEEKKLKSTKQLLKEVLDYKVWFSMPLQFATLWCFLGNTGYTICLFSLSNYARSLGFSHDQATNVTVALSVAQAFGRPSMGYFSEKFGHVNFTWMANLYVCVLVFGWWLNIHNYASLVCFAIFLGFYVGISSVNVVALVADVSGIADFPSALSYTSMWMAVSSIIAEVIALNLRDYSFEGVPNRTPYFYCQTFVGCLYFVGLFALIPYRAWKVNRMLFQLKGSRKIG
jgi:Na+/melibiose symporter-like transporter